MKAAPKAGEEIAPGIIRILIPFENITTSAFLLLDGENVCIYDAGTTKKDVESYILPAVFARGVRVAALVASHSHGDHFGGMPFLYEATGAPLYIGKDGNADAYATLPTACTPIIIKEESRLLSRFRLIPLRGHSDDGIAIFDEKTGTLLTGDALQCDGVGRYGCFFTDKAAYLETVARVRALAPRRLVLSHEYHPVGALHEGSAAVGAVCDAAEKTVDRITAFIRSTDAKNADAERLFQKRYPDLPPVSYACMEKCGSAPAKPQ